jgi:hypothetical protein
VLTLILKNITAVIFHLIIVGRGSHAKLAAPSICTVSKMKSAKMYKVELRNMITVVATRKLRIGEFFNPFWLEYILK